METCFHARVAPDAGNVKSPAVEKELRSLYGSSAFTAEPCFRGRIAASHIHLFEQNAQ